jgi:hypothetical protein
VGLTINTVPLTHFSRFGGLPGSFAFLIHFPIPFPHPHLPPVSPILVIEITAHIPPPSVTHLLSTFWGFGGAEGLTIWWAGMKNYTVFHDRVLCLVGLGLEMHHLPHCHDPMAWLSHCTSASARNHFFRSSAWLIPLNLQFIWESSSFFTLTPGTTAR